MLKSKQLLINHQLLMSSPLRDMYNQTGNDGLAADDRKTLMTILMYNQTLYTACFTLIYFFNMGIWERADPCLHKRRLLSLTGHQVIKL